MTCFIVLDLPIHAMNYGNHTSIKPGPVLYLWLSKMSADIHYDDVIMSPIASQITSLTIVYSTIYSGADQRKHQSSASLAFVRGIHRDRWIPRTKGQLRGKCFHLMTSSWKRRCIHKVEVFIWSQSKQFPLIISDIVEEVWHEGQTSIWAKISPPLKWWWSRFYEFSIYAVIWLTWRIPAIIADVVKWIDFHIGRHIYDTHIKCNQLYQHL